MTAFIIYVLTMAGIYGLMSLSLSLQYGQTGLVNFGQVGFFMVGAYASAVLTSMLGWPIIFGAIAGIIAAAVLGVLMALPIGDLRQDYWAIGTLVAAELVRIIFLNTTFGSPYIGASYGVSEIPSPLHDVIPQDYYGAFYLGLVVVCIVICYAVVVWSCRSPFGRVLKSVREGGDEVAQALGKEVRRARVSAMALGGGIAGLGGVLFAHLIGFIDPTYFLPLETFLVWAMVILGGAGNHLGALLGAVVIQAIYNMTRFLDLPPEFAALRMVLIGLIIVLVILFMPKGLLPERRRRYGGRHVSKR